MGESSHIDPLGRSTQEEYTLLYRTYVAAYVLFILALFNLKYDDSLHIAYCETSIVWKVSRYKLNQQTQVVRRITSCICELISTYCHISQSSDAVDNELSLVACQKFPELLNHCKSRQYSFRKITNMFKIIFVQLLWCHLRSYVAFGLLYSFLIQ